MSYFRICPLCGAHLDPGERCDCRNKEEDRPGAWNTETVKGEAEVSSPLFRLHHNGLKEEKQDAGKKKSGRLRQERKGQDQ